MKPGHSFPGRNIYPVELSLMEFLGVGNGLVAESKKFHSNFGGEIFPFLSLAKVLFIFCSKAYP